MRDPSGRLRPSGPFALLAIVLWLGSLALPAIGARGGPTLSGMDVLEQGFGAWRYGVLAWFANPALLVGIAASVVGAIRAGLILSTLGLILAVSSFWAGDFAALAGRSVPELSFGAGFYVWMASHASAATGAIVQAVRDRSSHSDLPGPPK